MQDYWGIISGTLKTLFEFIVALFAFFSIDEGLIRTILGENKNG